MIQNPALVWSFDAGAGVSLRGTMAALDGVLYLTLSDGTTLAVDASTGTEVWRSLRSYRVPVTTAVSGPVVDENHSVYEVCPDDPLVRINIANSIAVYTALDSYFIDHGVYPLGPDLAGELIPASVRRFPINPMTKASITYRDTSSPGDYRYLPSADRQEYWLGLWGFGDKSTIIVNPVGTPAPAGWELDNKRGSIAAALAGPGQPAWEFWSGAQTLSAHVMLGNDRVYVSLGESGYGTVFFPQVDCGRLIALNKDTGAVLWQRDIGSGSVSLLLVSSDGTLYVSAQSAAAGCGGHTKVVAISSDNKLLWETVVASQTNESVSSAALAEDGSLYASLQSGCLLRINSATGAISKTYDLGEAALTAPALVPGGGLYITTRGGDLIAIDPAAGEVWRKALGRPFDTAPMATADGGVLVSRPDGRLRAYSQDGTLLWLLDLSGRRGLPLTTDPIQAGNRIFVGRADGTIFCIGAQ
jgi:outer membrane protein assembly factor BamB